MANEKWNYNMDEAPEDMYIYLAIEASVYAEVGIWTGWGGGAWQSDHGFNTDWRPYAWKNYEPVRKPPLR